MSPMEGGVQVTNPIVLHHVELLPVLHLLCTPFLLNSLLLLSPSLPIEIVMCSPSFITFLFPYALLEYFMFINIHFCLS